MYDALTLAADHVNQDWAKMLSGSYSVSFGDNLSAFIGSGRQTHIVGDEIKYVLDWEGVLSKIPYLGDVLHSMPAQLLFGDGGNMTWTFGRKTDLHYIGPSIAIKRAGEQKATSRLTFFGADAADVSRIDDWDEWVKVVEANQKEEVDTTTGKVVALLSVLMLAINTGVEIAAKIKYGKGYKTSTTPGNPVDKEAVEGMTKYCTSTLMLTTRLMYLIKSVELVAVTYRNMITEFWKADSQLKMTSLAAFCAGDSEPLRKDITKRLKEAADATKKFLIGLAKILAAFVALLVGIGIIVGVAIGMAAADAAINKS
jgi:hypothetical protein